MIKDKQQRATKGRRRDTFHAKRTRATQPMDAKDRSLHFIPGTRRGVSQQALDSADRMMKQYQADLEYLKDR